MRDSGPGLSPENISRLFEEGVQFNANELQVRADRQDGMLRARGVQRCRYDRSGIRAELGVIRGVG